MSIRPRKFAERTKINDDETLRQIKLSLRKAGATGVLHLDREGTAILGFEFNNRAYRFDLPIPDVEAFKFTEERGLTRSGQAMITAWQNEVNRKWRALLDVIDGRLRSVTEGIATVERAFAMEAVMPNGQTVGDIIHPQIEQAYQTGQMPRLLMPPSEK